jgi:hypothetical protein
MEFTSHLPKLVVLCLMSLTALQAQSGNATITGSVTDPSGAAIDGATVSVRDISTGFTRTTTSNETGNYNLPGLRPGVYTVNGEHQGFRRYQQSNFQIEVDQTARLDMQLQLGQTTEILEVQGTAQLLHTENATVGAVIDTKKIVELPLNGRNFVQLALLVPGVSPGQPGASNGGGISIGGARSEQNAFQLDGVSNSDQWNSGITFTPSIDSIQEFKIEVNNYSAEFGKGAGGQINVVTKSGTNALHGSMWEFLRNNAVQARNLFQRDPNFVDSQGRFIAPPFKQNQFGAAAGGPVIKDRTFFFGYYEGFRNVRGTTGLRSVPNAAIRSGNFGPNLGAQVGTDALGRAVFANQIFDARSSRTVFDQRLNRNVFVRDPFPGNMIPAARIDPIAAKILQGDFWPAPNTAGSRDPLTGNPIQNFADGRSNRNTTDQFMGRVDHRFSSNDTVYGRLGWNNADSFSPGSFPGNERLTDNRQIVLGMNYTRVIGASKVNEFRFGWQHDRPNSGAKRILEGTDVVRALGIRGLPLAGAGAPVIGVSGFTGIDDGGENRRDGNTFQFINALSFNAGRHSIKIGGEVRRIMLDVVNIPANTRGDFNFGNPEWSGLEGFGGTGNNFANFLLGLPRQKARRPGDHTSYLRATEYGGFVQDDFKFNSRLTMNLGLRYQLYISPKETRNNISAMRLRIRPTSFAEGGINLCKDPARCAAINPNLAPLALGLTLNDLRVDRLPQVVVAGQDGVPSSLVQLDKLNFGPRVGFAFRVADKTTVRTGYGMFFDTVPMSYFQDAVENIPTVREDQQSLSSFQFGLPPAEAFIGFTNDDPPIGSFTPGPNTYDLDFRNAYMQQWNFGVQQQFGNSFVAEVSYAGSKGTRLNRRENFNTREPRNSSAIIPASVNPHLRRLLPFAVMGDQLITLDNWFMTTSTAFSNYHALLARFEKRYANGLTFINAFTWSKAMSDAQPFGGGNNDTGNRVQDMFNKRADKGLAPHDYRFRFVTSFVYDLPFGRGRTFGNQMSGVLNQVVGGWQINGIAQFQTGFPITVRRTGDPLAVGTDGAVRPNAICNANLPGGERTLERFFNPSCFVAPADTFGNAGRSTVTGPGLHVWDMAVFKNFQIREKASLQFRSEFFNAFNHPNWNAPGRDLGSSGFGAVTSAQEPRIIQFALKLLF